ncbi:MAG: hypothetical protein ACTHMI_16775 [Mucilaginibacter sp.]|uniref:hypothetical protein n=1 Tax=Mucilaginibacter sp. L3T2-6 TaxID=3062491 RepID=UPI00267489D8|nr:hypothetical protein [Mucilaginibacter sp. L3T2-6]MDO3642906.1 hypothetical protein [Mucilaginibacter sp. L3T2-6]MDV6215231.1 hypothetical protein [Mucilaginibacter sp. L3T2-6]
MTLNDFANLSVVLTGYPLSTILPQLDTQHQAEEFLEFLQTPGNVPAGEMDNLAAAWQKATASGDPVQGVKTYIMADVTLARLAQNIIMLWYLGVWYDLATPLTTGSFAIQVISGKAYKNGLAWGTMGAHPMGYSEENFGYWNTVPPFLNPQPSN